MVSSMKRPTILEIRQAAALEQVDPRSVEKVLQGGRVRGAAGVRAERAAERAVALARSNAAA